MKSCIWLAILGAVILAFGCSDAGNNPAVVGDDLSRQSDVNYNCWGMWQFIADPEKGELNVVQLRAGWAHFNVLPYLEPPPLVNLTLESVKFNGNIVDVDIGLRHPFAGSPEFTGFDVSGILITNGSVTGFDNPALRMAGEGDTRLLNPDALTRWFNPFEFASSGVYGYKDGLLGTPDSSGNYNSTLNAYKFFCDDLTDPNGSLDDLVKTSRCVFSAGKKNIRHYSIDMSAGLIFNYAVLASWDFPVGSPPWEVPDSFPAVANRIEPWHVIVTELDNTLWNDGVGNGGDLALSIELWDHYNADANPVYVESPGNFNIVGPLGLSAAGPGYATFEVVIVSATPAEDSIDLLITAECEEVDYQVQIPGETVAAYFTYTVAVANQPPVMPGKNIALREGFDAMDIAVDHGDGDLLVLYSDGAVWKYTESGGYEDGSELYLTYEPGIQYIDICPNSNSIVGGFWMNLADKMKVYADDGSLISNVDIGSGACWAHDVTGFTGHTYTNMAGLFSSTCALGSHLRWRFYPPPGYQSGYWYANLLNNACGPTKVHRDTTVGTEAGNISMYYVYYLEGAAGGCNEYRVQRLYRASGTDIINDPSVTWGGTKTDDMDGFWDPKDITRDVDNDFYILDFLSTGDPGIKKYTEDGTPVGEPFGDINSISGIPLRIEGSDYTGSNGNLLYVLHDNDPADMISIFYPSEIPD